MTARKSAAKGRTRTRNLTLRVDPCVHYLSEIVARKQRRTLTSFIEECMEQALRREEACTMLEGAEAVSKSFYDKEVVDQLWHPEEADRVLYLAQFDSRLLTLDEARWYVVVSECPIFLNKDGKFKYPLIRKLWPQVKKVADGADPSILKED